MPGSCPILQFAIRARGLGAVLFLLVVTACSGPVLRSDAGNEAPVPPPGVAPVNRALQTRNAPLETGARVPAFEMPDQQGLPVSAGELAAGGGAVLIFIPNPEQSGARPAFAWARRHQSLLASQGLELLLVAPQSPEANARLAEREELRLAVLADPQGWVAGAFGLGALRQPFTAALGPDGRLHHAAPGLPDPSEAIIAVQARRGAREQGLFESVFQ